MAKKTTEESDNLKFYEQLRVVPNHAIKPIQAGRLKGMSDINPVYRIKAMTEVFGPCGIGWKYSITKQWTEVYGQEVKVFTNVDLFIKVDGEWSEAIPGTGGSAIVAVERNGSYVSDEAYKMALTDALSVAMKSLGVAADIYYSKDKQQFDTKYEQQAYAAQQYIQQQSVQTPPPPPASQFSDEELQGAFELIMANIESAPSKEYLMDIYKQNPALHDYKPFMSAMSKRKKELGL